MLRLSIEDNDIVSIIDYTLKVFKNNYLTEINSLAFYGNDSLEEVYLNNVTEIGYDAFCECSKFKKAYLPKVQTINTEGFYYNPSLEEVHIGSDIISIASDAFLSSDNQNLKIYINKPQGSISGSPWGSTTAQVIWQG